MKIEAARTVQGAPDQLADELADAAHELKTPIAIALALCASAGHGADADALREDLRRIESHLRSLRAQLDGVLERGGHAIASPPATTRTGVAGIVRAATGTYAVVAARKDVELVVDAPDDVEAVVDTERLGVAVRNLVSNAVEYAPEGGVVRSSVRRAGPWARIEIADDGPGVPERHRASIFDRCRRLERDARTHSGSGLGLAIVRQIAAEHGGRIEVADAPEGGALFALELPTAAACGGGPRRLESVAT